VYQHLLGGTLQFRLMFNVLWLYTPAGEPPHSAVMSSTPMQSVDDMPLPIGVLQYVEVTV